jgi:hypothetical protein
MAAASYETALQLAQSLSSNEQLRLIQELTMRSSSVSKIPKQTSILEISGLGAEIWHKIDAQEHVQSERSTWAG